MKKITVFTPTYNRAYCLHQVYDSLVLQTNQNFIWLIIDDGSSDTTKELVDSWVVEDKIDIQYIYQNNQGMHGAHNTAYDNIKTELNTCIDSDDYMPNNAIEIILDFWESNGSDKVAGIVALDIDKNGVIIGSALPKNITQSTMLDIYQKFGVTGDKKLILRTEIAKKYPRYPIFPEERFVPLGSLYSMIDQDYELLCLNKPVCIVEYLQDGSSLNMFKQYRRHPRGFRYSRRLQLLYTKKFSTKIKKILHLISSTLFIGDFQFFKNNPEKVLTLLCLPIGVLFHIYIVIKSKQ